jgi:hypothetical protein
LPGYGDVATARGYERKIRNLLIYSGEDTKQMALQLLKEAGQNRKISIRQYRHLEKLFKTLPESPSSPIEK